MSYYDQYGYQQGGQAASSSTMRGRSNTNLDKAEQEMSVSVRKALSQEESAPKQKHVRVATVFTWEFKTAAQFWNAVKLHINMADEVQCFKALITIHKVMRDGHPTALEESMREVPFLDSMARNMQYNSLHGYAKLIQAYIQLLKAKLELHTIHPEFRANLDYEEYRALKKVDDPNEGYNTIVELASFLDKIDKLQKTIFSSFRPSSNNECRIAALVPLVEESYGVYQFMTSMLIAMHQRVDSRDALAPLRERYRQIYGLLQKFYFECSNLRYLTSLITVPKLPNLAPDFSDESEAKRAVAEPPREKTPPPDDLWGAVSSVTPEPNWALTHQQSQLQQQTSSSSMMSYNQAMLQQQQVVLHNPAEAELQSLREQVAQAQQMLMQRQSQVEQMEIALRSREHTLMQFSNSQTSLNLRDQERENMIRALEEQVAHWKTKYETISKMYAQLRKEHLDLLTRFKDVQGKAASAQLAIAEKEKLSVAFRQKTEQLATVTQECTLLKAEFERMKKHSLEEAAQLRREVTESQARLEQWSSAKGAETQELVAKFSAAQQESAARFQMSSDEAERLKSELNESRALFARLQDDLAAKDEEISVLQAGMDQSLLALQQIHEKQSTSEVAFLGKIDSMSLEHRLQTDKIMDSVLEDCQSKVNEAMFDMDGTQQQMSVSVTPQLMLSLLERATATSDEFSAAFVHHLTDGDVTGGRQADAIRGANNLTGVVTTILRNAKSFSTLIEGDQDEEEKEGASGNDQNPLATAFRGAAERTRDAFRELQSSQLSKIDLPRRPEKVQEHNGKLQSEFRTLLKAVEELVVKEGAPKPDGRDLVNVVEDELSNASRTIQEAAALLASLLAEDTPRDPKLTQVDFLSTQAITDAIGRLIIAATQSQQEIVASGRGSGSKGAFYKKNSRWVEGLASAAKAVATATKTLVESANGFVVGTHSTEQLIVATNGVASATAQLVAASRVKALRGSKLQEKLEAAAHAVSDATKLLVQAADHARSRDAHADSSAKNDVDFSALAPHEFKRREMEQQVRILTLEKSLTDARKRLTDMRRQAYHKEADV